MEQKEKTENCTQTIFYKEITCSSEIVTSKLNILIKDDLKLRDVDVDSKGGSRIFMWGQSNI